MLIITGQMFAVLLGILAIGLGCKGFTSTGLPLTNKGNVTGVPAKVIGVTCMLVGLGLIIFGISSFVVL